MQRPNTFHFKVFCRLHLHYEIRICQKSYNRVTMTVFVRCVVQFNVHKMLPSLWRWISTWETVIQMTTTINPSISNILRWVTGTIGQMNR